MKTQMAKVIDAQSKQLDTQSQEIRSQTKQIEALRQETAEMKAQIAAIPAKLDKESTVLSHRSAVNETDKSDPKICLFLDRIFSLGRLYKSFCFSCVKNSSFL